MTQSKRKTEILPRIHPYQAVGLFLLKILVLFLAWNFFYSQVIYNSKIDTLITENLAWISVQFLQLAGLDAVQDKNYVFIDKLPVVFIGNPCNAIEFFGLFAGFIIAYPSRVLPKLWFIPLGILFIHLLNVVRVILLALNLWYSRESFDFNHKYTFVVFLYGLTFLLCTEWVKRFAHAKKING